MSPLNPCVAGIDIGAASVFTCVGFPDGRQEVREYLTFAEDLKEMARWLKECGIKSVAMESTGVYWIPVYDILAQEGFDVVLVNAYCKKTDVKDCQWIQQLHAYGLLHGSFRPDNEGKVVKSSKACPKFKRRRFPFSFSSSSSSTISFLMRQLSKMAFIRT